MIPVYRLDRIQDKKTTSKTRICLCFIYSSVHTSILCRGAMPTCAGHYVASQYHRTLRRCPALEVVRFNILRAVRYSRHVTALGKTNGETSLPRLETSTGGMVHMSSFEYIVLKKVNGEYSSPMSLFQYFCGSKGNAKSINAKSRTPYIEVHPLYITRLHHSYQQIIVQNVNPPLPSERLARHPLHLATPHPSPKPNGFPCGSATRKHLGFRHDNESQSRQRQPVKW